MSLTNVAYNASYGWADPRVKTLEAQMLVPMLNEHPIEMGLKGNESAMVARIAGDPEDAESFKEAFGVAPAGITLELIVKAIASFERTLISANSPFDRYLYRDDRSALSVEARRGMDLFFSDRLACAQCHSGFNLSGPTAYEGSEHPVLSFHNTGLYSVNGQGAYPAMDRGLIDVTHAAEDMGKFRAPTLRNVAITAPYMHDGSIPTLEAAVVHYASGGIDSPFKSPRMKGFEATPRDISDRIAFLQSLTDEQFLKSPGLGPPQ